MNNRFKRNNKFRSDPLIPEFTNLDKDTGNPDMIEDIRWMLRILVVIQLPWQRAFIIQMSLLNYHH